jgi:hypothetical protein
MAGVYSLAVLPSGPADGALPIGASRAERFRIGPMPPPGGDDRAIGPARATREQNLILQPGRAAAWVGRFCEKMLALSFHELSLAATRARASLPLLGQAEGGETADLGWVIAVLGFGGLLVGCVWLLLRREGEPDIGWADGQNHGPHLQHVSRLLRTIRAVNSLVVTERDPAQLLRKACELLTTTRGYRMMWVGLMQEGSSAVLPVSSAGYEKGYLSAVKGTRPESGSPPGPTEQAVASGEPVVLRGLETAPEFKPWRDEALKRGYHALAVMPLRFRGQVLGALSVYAESVDAFDIEEVGLLQEVADHLAHALGSIRLETDLHTLRSRGERAMRLGEVFDGARAGVILTDADGLISDVNACMLDYLNGFDEPSDLIDRIGVRALALFAGSEAQDCIKTVLDEGKSAAFDTTSHPVSGRSIDLTCRGIPVLPDPEDPMAIAATAEGPAAGSLWLVQRRNDTGQ